MKAPLFPRSTILFCSALLALFSGVAGAQDEHKGECYQMSATLDPSDSDWCSHQVCQPSPGSGTCSNSEFDITWAPGRCNNENEHPCVEFEIQVPSHYMRICKCNDSTAHCMNNGATRYDPVWVTNCAS